MRAVETLEIVSATFNTLSDTSRAMQALRSLGVPFETDMTVLETAVLSPRPLARGLIAVRVGPGHVDREQAQAVFRAHGGQWVDRWAASPGALALLHGLPGARNPFRAPETILPPLLLQAMRRAPRSEQPDASAERLRVKR